MKIFLIISLITLFTTSNKKDKLFNDKFFLSSAVNDFKSKSCFIACSIASPNYTGNVVIENDDLYYYLSESLNLDKKKYKKFMLKKLLKNEVIDVSCTDIPQCRFFIADDSTIIKQNSEATKEEMVKKYFEDNMLKDGLNFRERNTIAYLLFKKGLKTKIDGESGSLYIPTSASPSVRHL
jgi:hypothetical protein